MWDLKKYGDATALLDESSVYLTYNELQQESDLIAKAVGKRTLVFVLCRNTIGSVVGYVGFLNNHIVPVLLNSELDSSFLENLLHIYKPPFIYCPKENVNKILYSEIVYEKFGYCLLKTYCTEDYPLFLDLALLLTTSGSTGSPKFVRQSYENIFENALSISCYLELNANERPVSSLPMNYTYGLSVINSHLLVGATILLTEKSVVQKEFWNFVKEQKATSFSGVPYTYEILDKIRFMRMDLPALTMFTQAGGKLTPFLHEKFAKWANEKHKKFVVMYGQCEATARMAYLPYEKALEKKGAMGIAIPGGEFFLVDEVGNTINTPFTVGELLYKGKNVTLGYGENPKDLTKGDEWHGILQTGDMAEFDTDGYYFIVGRKKRFLKIYGNRVNLDEVDRLLKEEFDNLDCASAGIDDRLYVFVTDEKLTERVQKFLASVMGLNPLAFICLSVDEIPKNDSGKTLYKELEKYYR